MLLNMIYVRSRTLLCYADGRYLLYQRSSLCCMYYIACNTYAAYVDAKVQLREGTTLPTPKRSRQL